MKKAWCPEGQAEENPVLEYFRYIIFEKNKSITIERPEKFGGNLDIGSYLEFEKLFTEKKIHPMDAKETATRYIEQVVKPVRDAILNDSKLSRMREEIQSFQVTR